MFFDEEIISEIKFYKEYMNNNDKFKINNTKNKGEDNKELNDIKNRITELDKNMSKKEENIKEILNQKDIIINNMNDKLLNQENLIIKTEKKFYSLVLLTLTEINSFEACVLILFPRFKLNFCIVSPLLLVEVSLTLWVKSKLQMGHFQCLLLINQSNKHL